MPHPTLPSSPLPGPSWSFELEQLRRSTLEVSKSGSSESPVPQLLDFLSFGEKPNLLRATPLSRILRAGAKVFHSSKGSGATYALSQRVPHVDVFVSHNWSVGRWTKFAALSYHFNIWQAGCVSLLVQLALTYLTCVGVLPTVDLAFDHYPRGVACKVAGIPTFLIVLMFMGDVRELLGLRGPGVFLDKTCINQEDSVIQQEALRKLGAFLFNSKALLVLYTDIYLTKLWTVYELACFLCLHSVRQIRWTPTVMPGAILIGLLIFCLANTITTFAEFGLEIPVGTIFGLSLAAPAIVGLFRRKARERTRMIDRFTDFTVVNCTCAAESDRPLVYRNISHLMRAAKAVCPLATEEEALTAFDALVKSKLPHLVESAMGSCGIRYRDLLVLSWASFGTYWLDNMVGLAYGMPWTWALRVCHERWLLILTTTPMTFLLMHRLARCSLHIKGPWEYLYVTTVGLSCLALGCCNYYGIQGLMSYLWSSDVRWSQNWVFWAIVAITVVQTLVTIWFFSSSAGKLGTGALRRESSLLQSLEPRGSASSCSSQSHTTSELETPDAQGKPSCGTVFGRDYRKFAVTV